MSFILVIPCIGVNSMRMVIASKLVGGKLIGKYLIPRILYMLVLIEFVNQITIGGKNNMKVYL